MAGVEINCPNCGATEFTAAENNGRKCSSCATVYYPPNASAAEAEPAPHAVQERKGMPEGSEVLWIAASLFVLVIALIVLMFALA